MTQQQPTSCPVCASAAIVSLCSRTSVPVLQNGLFATPAAAVDCLQGRLDIVSCESCGFAWNGSFDPAALVYGQGYENSQGHSDLFKAHLRARIERIVQAAPDGPVEVLEIGAGQGDFLLDVVQAFGRERVKRAIGFDPAFSGAVSGDGPVEIISGYFTEQAARAHGVSPDVIISRHTIEHIPDPLTFLIGLREALPEASSARLFIETPTNDWIVRNRVFHDFFYEHCSLFTLGSMAVALERSGFVPEAVSACFGGQYLWAEASAAPALDRASLPSREAEYVTRWRHRAEAGSAAGAVFVWGAGAKGATFVKLIDPGRTLIAGLVDINPRKQGHYIAATGHPILPPASLPGGMPITIFVMNPNYIDEVRQMLGQLDIAAMLDVID